MKFFKNLESVCSKLLNKGEYEEFILGEYEKNEKSILDLFNIKVFSEIEDYGPFLVLDEDEEQIVIQLQDGLFKNPEKEYEIDYNNNKIKKQEKSKEVSEKVRSMAIVAAQNKKDKDIFVFEAIGEMLDNLFKSNENLKNSNFRVFVNKTLDQAVVIKRCK